MLYQALDCTPGIITLHQLPKNHILVPEQFEEIFIRVQVLATGSDFRNKAAQVAVLRVM